MYSEIDWYIGCLQVLIAIVHPFKNQGKEQVTVLVLMHLQCGLSCTMRFIPPAPVVPPSGGN